MCCVNPPDLLSMKYPLTLNIFYHPSSTKGNRLVEAFYGFYLRNPKDALDRYLGIPVNLFPYFPQREELQLADSQYSVNIVMVDQELMMSSDWKAYSKELVSQVKELNRLSEHSSNAKKHLLIPVFLTPKATEFSPTKSWNFIGISPGHSSRKNRDILIRLTHRICELIGPPVKVFLSHAKQDGEDFTKSLREHIGTYTGLDTFFDANDIGAGEEFAEVIEENVLNSMLLVVHTDAYSSREWCRKEVLDAKTHNCPIVVINQFQKGESRSFPYMGNVPHVHYAHPILDETQGLIYRDFIVLEALREVLRTRYHTLRSKALAEEVGQTPHILIYPPELLSLHTLEKEASELILYPDPPLGWVEKNLLAEFRPKLTLVTPTTLPLSSTLGSGEEEENPMKVGLSFSESSLTRLSWVQNKALENIMVELARYLLVGGARLIYSGDLRYEQKGETYNFARLLAQLVENYRRVYQKDEDSLFPLINYSAYPLYDTMDKDFRFSWNNKVDFIRVPPPDYLNLTENDAGEIMQFDNFTQRYVWAKSLSAMRQTMMDRANSDAWIILGGKWTGFKGRMAGVLEEYLTASQLGQPIFLLGGFGGVSKGVSDVLQGKDCEPFSLPYYQKHYPAYLHFVQPYNEHPLTTEEEQVNYPDIQSKIYAQGSAEADFGLKNGLNREENLRLFATKNELEIVHLILKGLNTLNS